jgi:predicted aspartyl protease
MADITLTEMSDGVPVKFTTLVIPKEGDSIRILLKDSGADVEIPTPLAAESITSAETEITDDDDHICRDGYIVLPHQIVEKYISPHSYRYFISYFVDLSGNFHAGEIDLGDGYSVGFDVGLDFDVINRRIISLDEVVIRKDDEVLFKVEEGQVRFPKKRLTVIAKRQDTRKGTDDAFFVAVSHTPEGKLPIDDPKSTFVGMVVPGWDQNKDSYVGFTEREFVVLEDFIDDLVQREAFEIFNIDVQKGRIWLDEHTGSWRTVPKGYQSLYIKFRDHAKTPPICEFDLPAGSLICGLSWIGEQLRVEVFCPKSSSLTQVSRQTVAIETPGEEFTTPGHKQMGTIQYEGEERRVFFKEEHCVDPSWLWLKKDD